jgi:hypothetical protein
MTPSRRLTLGILIAATVLFGLLLPPAGLAIMMSPMAFDSGVNAFAVALVATLLTYPLAMLVSIPSSWIAYRRGAYRAAVLLSLLPATNVLAMVAMFALWGDWS